MALSSSYPADTSDRNGLIGDAYEVLLGHKLSSFGGGLVTFAVRDHRHGRHNLMAIQSAEGSPERPFALANLRSAPIDNILLPLAHGVAASIDGREAWFVILPQPPGDPVWTTSTPPNVAQRIWTEGELLDCVLRPAARALNQLLNMGMTHRAIRPNNVFQAMAGQAVTLGYAWAGPPAALQTALFEPPYSGMCHPSARGDGTIADDVYALGILLATLASGRLLLEGLDEDAVIRRKLDRGCFSAVCGDLRLPPAIADLVHGMLADNPDHRPSPASLIDPAAARGRKVITRQRQNAPRPIIVGSIAVSSARCLSFELSRHPQEALKLLADRSVGTWVRRTLDDPVLANRLDEVVRACAADMSANRDEPDSRLVMCSVAILDPLAPLCWRGLSMFPSGLGPALAHAHIAPASMHSSMLDHFVELVQTDTIVLWGDVLGNRAKLPFLRSQNSQHRVLLRIDGWGGGASRLRYTLNPLLPCSSSLVGNSCVARISDLLPALERVALGNVEMIDAEIAAFIATRFSDRDVDADLAILAKPENAKIEPSGHRGLAQLRIFARLAMLDASQKWPQIATRLLHKVSPALKQWRSKETRASREADLLAASKIGLIGSMSKIFEDSHARLQDSFSGQRAEQELGAIEQKLNGLRSHQSRRTGLADTAGQEIATALGVIGLAISAIIAAL